MNLPAPTPERGPFGRTGRIGWPTVVQYRTRDGRLHMCPPREPWVEIVHKQAERDYLAATGQLYGAPHTCAVSGTVTDNRRTA